MTQSALKVFFLFWKFSGFPLCSCVWHPDSFSVLRLMRFSRGWMLKYTLSVSPAEQSRRLLSKTLLRCAAVLLVGPLLPTRRAGPAWLWGPWRSPGVSHSMLLLCRMYIFWNWCLILVPPTSEVQQMPKDVNWVDVKMVKPDNPTLIWYVTSSGLQTWTAHFVTCF